MSIQEPRTASLEVDPIHQRTACRARMFVSSLTRSARPTPLPRIVRAGMSYGERFDEKADPKAHPGAAPNAWLRQCGRAVPLAQRFSDPKGLLLDLFSYRFRRRAAARGLRTNPAFAGTYEFDAAANFAALFPRFLDCLPDGSVVMCHPGFVDAELERLDPLTTLREREHAFLAGDAFPSLIAANGIALA